jgi:hypothetical protein
MTNMLCSSVYLTRAIITLSVIIIKASSSKKTMIKVRDLVHRMIKNYAVNIISEHIW